MENFLKEKYFSLFCFPYSNRSSLREHNLAFRIKYNKKNIINRFYSGTRVQLQLKSFIFKINKAGSQISCNNNFLLPFLAFRKTKNGVWECFVYGTLSKIIINCYVLLWTCYCIKSVTLFDFRRISDFYPHRDT